MSIVWFLTLVWCTHSERESFLVLQFVKEFYNKTWIERYGEPIGGEAVTLLWSITVSIFAIGGLLGALSVSLLLRVFGRSVDSRVLTPCVTADMSLQLHWSDLCDQACYKGFCGFCAFSLIIKMISGSQGAPLSLGPPAFACFACFVATTLNMITLLSIVMRS